MMVTAFRFTRSSRQILATQEQEWVSLFCFTQEQEWVSLFCFLLHPFPQCKHQKEQYPTQHGIRDHSRANGPQRVATLDLEQQLRVRHAGRLVGHAKRLATGRAFPELSGRGHIEFNGL
jgi:hypothetical protein